MPTEKTKTLTNRTGLKKYILQRCHEIRKYWDCQRVSAEALDHFEITIDNCIRRFVQNYPGPLIASSEWSPCRDIICVKNVKAKLLIGLQGKLVWVKIAKLDDAAVDFISHMLVVEVDIAIRSHPTLGKTFKV